MWASSWLSTTASSSSERRTRSMPVVSVTVPDAEEAFTTSSWTILNATFHGRYSGSSTAATGSSPRRLSTARGRLPSRPSSIPPPPPPPPLYPPGGPRRGLGCALHDDAENRNGRVRGRVWQVSEQPRPHRF